MSARVLLILLLLCLPRSQARDLGVIGPTWPIAEPHLLHDIEQRLRSKEDSGELNRQWQQLRARARQQLETPPPVLGLRTTQQARTFYLDPSYTLQRNVLDGDGHLLFAAGTRHNPLDILSLSSHLLLFDARDPRQTRLARRLLAHYKQRLKLILVAGSWQALRKRWQQPVFYDQHGVLSRRLEIRQVPALISQQGTRLRVDELELAQ